VMEILAQNDLCNEKSFSGTKTVQLREGTAYLSRGTERLGNRDGAESVIGVTLSSS
jgi:hypothetical protein